MRLPAVLFTLLLSEADAFLPPRLLPRAGQASALGATSTSDEVADLTSEEVAAKGGKAALSDEDKAVEESMRANPATAGVYAAPASEIARRRNLAIIAHPDAGKTTLTEKLLLYGGAVQQAGAVRSRADQRQTTSDWMELEKKRGISITSTVLTFEYQGNQVNLLDTPGHQDFSEDTYRTLAAADNAVCLVDAAKGLEPQTRKLLEVCRLSGKPIFTFCNKLDRPALEPLELIDQIEGEFGLTCCPVLWPIGDGPRFQGVLDREDGTVHLFARGDRTGRAENLAVMKLDDPDLEDAIGPELYAKARTPSGPSSTPWRRFERRGDECRRQAGSTRGDSACLVCSLFFQSTFAADHTRRSKFPQN